jgi:DNA-binding CsgD family transcriptional regulator
MKKSSLKTRVRKFPVCDAFIFYSPKTEGEGEQVYYNNEACRIVSMKVLPPSKGMDPFPDFPCLCAQWKGLVDKRITEQIGSGGGKELGAGFIDLYQSWRRKYILRGTVLLGCPPKSESQDSRYLFILERISQGMPNLGIIFRRWNLSHREQDIVRLLFEDRSNKEIADTLHLSINTVKAYLKLLMRKLGVVSRAGMISLLLSGRIP